MWIEEKNIQAYDLDGDANKIFNVPRLKQKIAQKTRVELSLKKAKARSESISRLQKINEEHLPDEIDRAKEPLINV